MSKPARSIQSRNMLFKVMANNNAILTERKQHEL